MATGELIVNGTDLYSSFGAYVQDGGLAGFLQLPSTKEVETESYRERSGIDADLSSLKVQSRDFTVNLALSGNSGSIRGLYDTIGNNPYATFSVPSIGLQKAYRVKGVTGIDYAEKLSLCSLKLSDDTPSLLTDETYVAPSSSLVRLDNSFKLDTRPLSSYGIVVIQGTENGIRREGDIKELLTRDISTVNGLLYDNDEDVVNTFDSATITLKCVMYAANLTEFWRNYNALLYDLIREKEATYPTDKCKRSLYVSELGKKFACYYTGQEINDYGFKGIGLWITFGLSFKCLDRGTALIAARKKI